IFSNLSRPGAAWIANRLRAARRTRSRVFLPALDGRLEARALLSGSKSPFVFGKNYLALSAHLLRYPNARNAFNVKAPPQFSHGAPHFNNVNGFRRIRYIGTQTRRGGQAVEVTALDGSHYQIKLSYTSNTLATNIAEGSNGQAGISSPQAVTSQI